MQNNKLLRTCDIIKYLNHNNIIISTKIVSTAQDGERYTQEKKR